MRKTLRAFLDRYEENMAVLIVDDREIVFPKEFIPEDAEEGSILGICVDLDYDKTKEARDKVEKLIDRLG